jgi:hypothetical protein
MLHLGSDATSLVIHSAARAKTEKNLIAHRRGRDVVELLMQRGWVKTISGSGREELAMIVVTPRPLTAAAVAAAAHPGVIPSAAAAASTAAAAARPGGPRPGRTRARARTPVRGRMLGGPWRLWNVSRAVRTTTAT